MAAEKEVHETQRCDALSVEKVAIVGTGVIGSGWAALFVARSLSVVAFCRNESSKERFREKFCLAYNNLRARNMAKSTAEKAWSSITVVSTLKECVNGEGIQYVQESVVEDVKTKQRILQEIDALAHPDIIIGSSTSYLPLPVCSLGARKNPGRIATAHPSLPQWDNFCEVLGSTSEDTAWLVHFFEERLKMDVVKLNKTHYGHCFNAMLMGLNQASGAIRRSGVSSDEDIDKAAVHLARLIIASGGVSGAMVGLVGGGSPEATENLCTDIVSGFPLASTASFLGKYSFGRKGPVATFLLSTLQALCWVFTTAFVRSGLRSLVRRFFVAPLAVAFGKSVNAAGSLDNYRKCTLGRVVELEKIR